MKRIEIIFSQALREDLLEWVEAASKDLSPKPMYTLIPEVLGKGNSNPKMNDAVWPEVNEIIIIYTDHVARLGDVAFATNPFELFLNYGNQIRARSLAKQTFLTQLCCGAYGYLPTEKAERGSHYSAFVSSGTTGHVGGEMLVRKTLKEINEMFAEGCKQA